MGLLEIFIVLVIIGFVIGLAWGVILGLFRALIVSVSQGNKFVISALCFLGISFLISLEFAVRLFLFVVVAFLVYKLIQSGTHKKIIDRTRAEIEDLIRQFKLCKIERQSVFLEVEQGQKLPLNGLGIFVSVNETKRGVFIMFPFLDETGALKFCSHCFDLLYVRVHSIHQEEEQDDRNFLLIKRISPFMQEIVKLQQDRNKQKQEMKQIENLLTLVSTSDFYSGQKNLYERALSQIQQIIQKGERLENLYSSYIRELLIGKELSDYNPKDINNNHIALDIQYKQIKEEYEKEKDEANAYSELLNTNQL